MWNMAAMALAFILAAVSLYCIVKKKGNQTLFSATLVVGAGLVILFNNIPIENIFHTFPSPQAIVDYLGSYELLGAAEGQDSCLLLYYAPHSWEIKAMLAPRSGNGYKLGTSEDKGLAGTLTQGGWTAQIFSSARSDDLYVYITGASLSPDVTVSDTIGTPFQTLLTPIPAGEEGGESGYSVISFAPLYQPVDGPCRVTVNASGEEAVFQF